MIRNPRSLLSEIKRATVLMKPCFSIIIPTYNEEEAIGSLLSNLESKIENQCAEIIVVDAGSTDSTAEIAKQFKVQFIKSETKGRAAQLNKAAALANHDILYFLHADTFPPENFLNDIGFHFKNGAEAGCFRLSFDHKHWLLNLSAWLTRFRFKAFRFGDQSLYVSKRIFEQIGGYAEGYSIMEDQEIVHRITEKTKFKVIPKKMLTSARKYRENGILRLQLVFLRICLNYHLGKSQDYLLSIYNKSIKDHRINANASKAI